MSTSKYLIDTNVFIGLEDSKATPQNYSSLINLASKHKIDVYIHEAARDDIEQDKDLKRRAISLSKIAKFQTLSKVRGLSKAELEKSFGPIKRHNDLVDATLLHALSISAADFLVTEDRGLHERARKYSPNLVRRVLLIADAVLLLQSTYEPVAVPVNCVEEVEAYQIPLTDKIFDSLREGYPGFDDWWTEKCVKAHRKCWTITDDCIAGIIVRKDETSADTDAVNKKEKILKICTFKVRPEKRGVKLGELLLKQSLWFAQKNHYDLVYLTTFPEQETLIDLIEYYGFEHTATSESNERTYEKIISRQKLISSPEATNFDLSRKNYPRFCADDTVDIYCVPIRESFHDILFPELMRADLFSHSGISDGPKRPGNTIRKVYICRAKINSIKKGSILLFYKGKSEHEPSQMITAIGVFEDLSLAYSYNELLQLAGGRSVYTAKQFEQMKASESSPVKVINFLLVGYPDPAIRLFDLIKSEIFKQHPPQSICKIPRDASLSLLKERDLGFEV
ncbi:GCN5 family acetyltransferase [Thalassospira indica]|uniref:GNAT family N-acetyltransferase n=1 Tax=Thalassospira indica TaxID=1891279 RepID=A0ABM6Y1D3_9PROT|nr:GCN5 family acetyltransferase [Thalassospira indica]AXO15726.1 GNAT family N-acetyltransferase [Thalassospira indica]OAZ14134.1 GCN5 family acetyltransferase [Thalassospira profundimaris]